MTIWFLAAFGVLALILGALGGHDGWRPVIEHGLEVGAGIFAVGLLVLGVGGIIRYGLGIIRLTRAATPGRPRH